MIQIKLPLTPSINIISAAPEPLPVPKSVFKIDKSPYTLINGSHTLSTIKPPKNNPIGIVKNFQFLMKTSLLDK